MTERIRLLIADDHPIVRVGLLDVLSSQPDFEVVGEATTGAEAVKLTDQLQPDVVLMDLRMPEMDGVTATARIKAKHPDTYILIVTTQDSEAEILSAIKSGATGYLLKDAPSKELFEAIRATAQGKPLLASTVASRLMEQIRGPAEEAPGDRETEGNLASYLPWTKGTAKDTATPKQVSSPPTGTVTFLFTDIEGSTSMWERDPAQMQAALARHDEILRTSVEASGGYVFKTVGDAFCAAFATARQALEATLAAQRALFAEEWGESTTVRVRMALHTGATEERDGDYFGPPVNRVARLLSAGHGGQVLLSAVTYGLVRDNLSLLEPGAELRDLGEHRLKDLRYAERIYQFTVPDLPSEFPSLKTLDTRSNERYSLAKLMGSGETAEVYLAHDHELDRDVAFKVLRSQYAGDEQFVERFKREARSAASLSHPNIIQVYDRGETEDGAYYMVMECVPGDTLKERITKEGPLPAPTAVALTLQIARALEVAHRQGVVHRDIKPQNILLTESGEAKVTDFGIARAASSSKMTATGFVMGTVHYISPEQALGQPASPQSDLYSLGVVLYEMLTGETPHDANTPMRVAMGHVKGHLRPPKEVNPDVPEEINAVTVRLLARNPQDRYQSAAELIKDLERLQGGESPASSTLQEPRGASPADTMPASLFIGASPEAQPHPRAQKPAAASTGPKPTYPTNVTTNEARHRKVPLWALVAAGLVGIAVILGILLGIGLILRDDTPTSTVLPNVVGKFQNEAEKDSPAAITGEGPGEPAPGYELVSDDAGKLWAEVPLEWSDHITSKDGTFEGEDVDAGKGVGPAITASTDINAWQVTGESVPGMYMLASKELASEYSEDELTDSGFNDRSASCKAGARHDFDRSPYSGRVQMWNCEADGSTIYAIGAAREDRKCVVMLNIKTYSETDREAAQHILDTFDADCERIT